MLEIRRLGAVGAVLALAAVFTCTHVWGEPGRAKDSKEVRPVLNSTAGRPDLRSVDDLMASKFTDQHVVTYRTQDGDIFAALQVKPKLEAGPVRPRDYLLLVDTSASKAEGPLDAAKKLVEALVKAAAPEDRFAIWTVNAQPRDLSRGFKSKDQLADVLKTLKDEFPAGATNLKEGLSKSLASFENARGRQQLILSLGDGKSIAGPLNPDERARLSDEMVKREVAFFPVPLGDRLDPLNLHGFANATGGPPSA